MKAYVIAETHELSNHSMIRGTLVVFSSYARILIDRGTSHLFISARFVSASKLWIELLPYPLHVSAPFSKVVELRDLCKVCTLTIVGYEFTFDFILLEMVNFNIIVGMEWLTTFRAHIDCYRRRVTFWMTGGSSLKFIKTGNWTPTPSPMESMLANLRTEDT